LLPWQAAVILVINAFTGLGVASLALGAAVQLILTANSLRRTPQ
jgi:hypothetical protein